MGWKEEMIMNEKRKERLKLIEATRKKDKQKQMEREKYKREIKQQQRETRLLRKTGKLVKVRDKEERKQKIRKIDRDLARLQPRMLEKNIGSRKESKYRARAVGGLIAAAGITGKQTYKGAGRPRGTYKYGMPIQVYKAQMRQKRALYEQYQQEQATRLKPRGFTPEQLQQLQQQQTYEELEQPTRKQIVGQMQRQQVRQEPPQREYQKMRVPTNTKYIEPGPSVADEELNFRKWSAEQTISPNTQRILDTIRRIQNKGKSDNIEQQRRIRERNMVMKSMNMMKAHENMIDTSMDFTGVKPEENILFAPNVFKEDAQNNILRTRGANILNTGDYGNNLKFF